MNYSDFCQKFYIARSRIGIRGCTSQSSIALFFLEVVLGKNSSYLGFEPDLFTKWFKGTRPVTRGIWSAVTDKFNDVEYSRILVQKLNEKYTDELLTRFGVHLHDGEPFDKEMFSIALAKQFLAIAKGDGEAEDIVESAYREDFNIDAFPTYAENSLKKYEKMKTLLYTSEERPFDDFFVCNTVTMDRYHFMRNRKETSKVIENVTLDKLLSKSRFSLIVGMGGIGKSMMMRHLFLESIRIYPQTGLLPILVTLREFGTENSDLFGLIMKSVNRFDTTFTSGHLHKLLMNGKCQLLLDGMDEVKHTDLETFQLQLDALVDRYPQNQFVMSTRQFSSFVALSRFQLVWMLPFSLEQSLNLIDRLDFCPEEPKLKKEFRDKLEHEYINTHNAFVSNPLLLTLMLMNFRRFSDVPEKKYLFYQQAYETLLLRHDADKLAYRRVFHSVKDPADFTEVFREFCAKSYRHGDYEFDQKLFDDYFDKLHKKNEIVSDTMTADNFLKDILHSVCLMYEESHSYHFLHRSFQEYFFADYYCRQDDTTLRKLGEALSKPNQNVYDDGNGFEMLYELDHYKVEKFILQAFLQEIFDGKSTEEEEYLTFLEKGYSKLVYVYIDPEKTKKYSKIEKSLLEYSRVNVPATIILSFILKQCNVDAHFTIGNLNAKLQYPEFLTVYLFGQAFSRRKKENQIAFVGIKKHLYDEIKKENNYRIIDGLVKDESGEYVVFGREYSLMFKDVIEKKDTYSALFDVLNQPSCEAYQKFVAVKDYYNKLVARIEKAEDVEDDDF